MIAAAALGATLAVAVSRPALDSSELTLEALDPGREGVLLTRLLGRNAVDINVGNEARRLRALVNTCAREERSRRSGQVGSEALSVSVEIDRRTSQVTLRAVAARDTGVEAFVRAVAACATDRHRDLFLEPSRDVVAALRADLESVDGKLEQARTALVEAEEEAGVRDSSVAARLAEDVLREAQTLLDAAETEGDRSKIASARAVVGRRSDELDRVRRLRDELTPLRQAVRLADDRREMVTTRLVDAEIILSQLEAAAFFRSHGEPSRAERQRRVEPAVAALAVLTGLLAGILLAILLDEGHSSVYGS